jgi:hypothetical protein
VREVGRHWDFHVLHILDHLKAHVQVIMSMSFIFVINFSNGVFMSITFVFIWFIAFFTFVIIFFK